VTQGLTAALRAAVGAEHVVTDADVMAAYERDWTGAYRGRALAVVRPASTDEVVAVVDACRAAGAPLVPQGGNTGLVGGSVPDASGRAVVVSTRRLAARGVVDTVAGQATFGAGVTLEDAQLHARASGFEVPVDLAARASATVGGMAATNAGGVHVMRYGTMRRNVVGVEAVTGEGRTLSHLAGLDKDNTGYDLAALLCGSEGTLAVITAVRARLVPVAAHRVTALLAFEGLDAAVGCLTELRASVDGLDAAEYVVRAGLDLVMAQFDLADPFDRPYPTYLLIEASGARDPTDELTAAVGRSRAVVDAAVAASRAQRDVLWQLRDLHTEAVAAAGVPRKFDVTVPVARVPEFVAAAATLLQARGATVYHWGHLGDGNVHLNVLGLPGGGRRSADVDAEVLALVAGMGGSISAEHGVGRLKRAWLHLSRTEEEVEVFRAVKAAFDPQAILNPGVLLPDPAPPS
jgi:FAD/FMN-containing dehydrogenase